MSDKGITRYSAEAEGSYGNHEQPARFDVTDGHVGITQGKDRVLLSPAQMRALLAFIHSAARSRHPRTTRT